MHTLEAMYKQKIAMVYSLVVFLYKLFFMNAIILSHRWNSENLNYQSLLFQYIAPKQCSYQYSANSPVKQTLLTFYVPKDATSENATIFMCQCESLQFIILNFWKQAPVPVRHQCDGKKNAPSWDSIIEVMRYKMETLSSVIHCILM